MFTIENYNSYSICLAQIEQCRLISFNYFNWNKFDLLFIQLALLVLVLPSRETAFSRQWNVHILPFRNKIFWTLTSLVVLSKYLMHMFSKNLIEMNCLQFSNLLLSWIIAHC